MRSSSPDPPAGTKGNLERRGISASIWIVAAVLMVQALALRHELSISRFDLNDNVFHLALIERTVQAIEQAENPFDFWVSEWTFGYPVLRTYNPLGHVLVASAYFAFAKSLSVETIFVWVRFLLLCTWPLSLYISARLLGLRPLVGAAAAMLVPLISTDSLFGLGYGSFVWRGSGLFSQLLALHFFALSLGLAARAMRIGKGLTIAGFSVGLTFLAHMIYGYMAAVSIAVIAVSSGLCVRRLSRLAFIGAVALATSAFHLAPLIFDARWINRSRWEPAWKWDSFGAPEVFAELVGGKLLDFGRFPILTLLVLVGIGCIGFRHFGSSSSDASKAESNDSSDVEVIVLIGSSVWILLFCGRSLWGDWLQWIGIGDTVQLHRFIGGVHYFLILLAAIGLAGCCTPFAKARPASKLGIVLLALLMFLPAVRERFRYLRQNQLWGETNLQARHAEQGPLDSILESTALEPGRLFAGLGADWGRDFRVGSVPLYALLSRDGLPALSYLYHAMALTSDIMVHFDESSPAHYRLFNVSSVLSEEGRESAPFCFPVAAAGRFRLSRCSSAGYFDLVSVIASAPADRDSFYEINKQWLESEWPAHHQYLELDLQARSEPAVPSLDDLAPRGESATAASDLGSVLSEERELEVYRARVDVKKESHLVFKMTYHRNWEARVNGEVAAPVMLTPGFLGLALEPGVHQVDFRYRSEWWKLVLMILTPLVLVCGRLLESRLKILAPSATRSSAVKLQSGRSTDEYESV